MHEHYPPWMSSPNDLSGLSSQESGAQSKSPMLVTRAQLSVQTPLPVKIRVSNKVEAETRN